jgi:exopolysaccharide biosynthesis polyprenyl glycosylphosphotransferase
MHKTTNRIKLLILVLGDILVIFIAFALSGLTRFGNFYKAFTIYQLSVTILVTTYLVNFYIFKLYESHQRFKSTYFISRFVIAVSFGFLFTALLSYSVPLLKVGRGIALLSAIYILLFVPLWRFIFEDFIAIGFSRKRVIIVGAGHSGRYICDVLKNKRDYEIVGFIDDDVTKHDSPIHGVSVLGGADVLLSMTKNRLVDAVIVAITHEKTSTLWDVLLAVKMSHIEVVDVAYLYESLMGKIPVSHLRMGWIVFSSFSAISKHLYLQGKRYFDIFLSMFGLIVSLPVMFLVVLAIKIDSRGPVIYKQSRVGENGKEFLIYKFRSMEIGAEKKDGGLYTSTNDARITRVGKFIRKVHFDELPQLWNIFVGDMSIVGPRPEAVNLSKNYAESIPYYSLRHAVKPGLTGWAQVRYSYSASKESAFEKFQYDMFYLKNMSFFLDIQIVLKTISVIVFREFSR